MPRSTPFHAAFSRTYAVSTSTTGQYSRSDSLASRSRAYAPARRASVRADPSARSLPSCSTARANRSWVLSSRLISYLRQTIAKPSSRPAAARIRARLARAPFSASSSWSSRASRSAGWSCSVSASRSRGRSTWRSGTSHRATAASAARSTRPTASRDGARRVTSGLRSWWFDGVLDLAFGVALFEIATVVQQLDMRQGFGHRHAALEPGQVVPCAVPTPPHVRGDLVPAQLQARPRRQQRQDLVQALPVMCQQLFGALGQATEWLAVARQHQLDLQLADQPQRVQVVRQRIAHRPPVQANLRRDVGQHVDARQQHLVALVVQADVPGRVARRPDHPKRESPARDLLAPVERAIGERDLDALQHAHAAAVQPVQL